MPCIGQLPAAVVSEEESLKPPKLTPAIQALPRMTQLVSSVTDAHVHVLELHFQQRECRGYNSRSGHCHQEASRGNVSLPDSPKGSKMCYVVCFQTSNSSKGEDIFPSAMILIAHSCFTSKNPTLQHTPLVNLQEKAAEPFTKRNA